MSSGWSPLAPATSRCPAAGHAAAGWLASLVWPVVADDGDVVVELPEKTVRPRTRAITTAPTTAPEVTSVRVATNGRWRSRATASTGSPQSGVATTVND